ncbi:hypothetical protein GMLC_05110 [Geomonas limicola]|uniref:Response regulator n=1 Tax=Geomonas limicola TaxID=2740186 RepID=A0A6V8N328_9BACT|nr:response regulator [Geomonas limicola]GFO66932.1 hypothetical protein GMLC_05110 [Geomonas limicola]
MTIEEAFGAVIRRLRRERKLSQEQLSLASFLDRTFISHIEGGKQQPSMVSLFALASALNVLPSDIISEVEIVLNLISSQRLPKGGPGIEKQWIRNLESHMKGAQLEERSETVLVVDDELQVREVICELLRAYGFPVLEAEDGMAAVQLVKEQGENISLVIMDVAMPRKNGLEAYHEIKKLRPGLQIILVSGYHSGIFDSEVTILQKPFSPETLLTQMRLMLGASPPG